eukprot:symbB.v1.2.022154.t2/scaffold1953.1/size126199/5
MACEALNPEAFGVHHTAALQLPVDVLSLVFYQCRSLEHRLQTTPLPVSLHHPRDSSPPTEEQCQKSDATHSETLEDDYWEKASKDGNRVSHYRNPHLGTTLVWDFGKLKEIEVVEKLLNEVEEFRKEVTKALPGYYVFFDDTALHVTVRGMQ